MFKLLQLSFLLAISSVSHAAEIALSSPNGWSEFLEHVNSADSDGLDVLTTRLREASDANAHANEKAFMLNRIAERQIELGQLEKALPVLEYVIDHPLPDDPETAAKFASDWYSAACTWTEKLYDLERSKEALDKFRSLPPDRGSFGQQVAQSFILVAWTEPLDHSADADQVTRTEFDRLTKLLPERPHWIAIDRYIDLIDFARAVDREERIAELNRVRDRVRRRIASENDLSAAFPYVQQVLNANLHIAPLLLADDPHTPMIKELANEIESCARHVEKLIDSDSPRSEQNLAYLRRQKDVFLRYVDRKIKRREALQELHVIHSKLLGTTCPEIEGSWIQKSQLNPEPALGDVTLLDFWSTTCGPCIQAFPKLSALQTRLESKGFRIVGVAHLTQSSWSDKESHFINRPDADEQARLHAMKKFTEYCDVNYDQVVDIEGSVFEAFEIKSLPTYVVVGRDQKVKWMCEGGDAEFELLVERLEVELGVPRSDEAKPEQ